MSRFEDGRWDADLREASRRRRRRGPPRGFYVVVVAVVVGVALLGMYAWFYAGFDHKACCQNPTYTLKVQGQSSWIASNFDIVNLSYAASTGLTTSMTVLTVTWANGTTYGEAVPPSSCESGSSFNACAQEVAKYGASPGWFALLLTLGGDVLTDYPASAGSSTWATAGIDFDTGTVLVIVSNLLLAGSHAELAVTSSGPATVNGSWEF